MSVQEGGTRLSDPDAHEARATLLRLSAVRAPIKRAAPNLENVAERGSRGARANAEAQKRTSEREERMSRPLRIQKLQ